MLMCCCVFISMITAACLFQGGCVIDLFENDGWKLAPISQPNSLVCDNLCY